MFPKKALSRAGRLADVCAQASRGSCGEAEARAAGQKASKRKSWAREETLELKRAALGGDK